MTSFVETLTQPANIPSCPYSRNQNTAVLLHNCLPQTSERFQDAWEPTTLRSHSPNPENYCFTWRIIQEPSRTINSHQPGLKFASVALSWSLKDSLKNCLGEKKKSPYLGGIFLNISQLPENQALKLFL